MALPDEIQPLAARLGGQLSFAAVHLGTGGEIRHDVDRRFPAASLIKVPMLATVLASVAGGHLDLAEPYTLRDTDKVGDEGILHLRPAGSIWTLEQLVELMIHVSDNTATNVLIDRMGGYAPYMDFFPALGLSSTVLQRHMIDYEAREAGRDNWTTTADMFELMCRLGRKELVDPAVSRQMVTIMLQQQDREKLPAKMPPEFPIASKPGELPGGVRHDMGIVYTHGGPVVIALLSEGTDESIADDTLADIALALFDAVGGEAYQGT
ncbi:MAG: serine hydrolase [Candidatus Sericytochromatia bacterium]|nr:serine hydrolase [Candidatus Sericytochromatia bacterium]